ncbi:hypothetical protein BU24DRAFT_418759 [Aaosphaeria arxii CBS 175.79]|uniref:SMP domain-containing protein n=1 Tax=Aaosphaeria arxii CBS 175.79 TaxID=1450172 RepID=A0A6A5Y2W8_9PLEO|nr:uncharacterized protein BU24DRAFT_418759 [Aaosphaeria arxii CBS 175.79]KAF2019150.1 hypothetical protein BU24DRAFT_418759 [Aaosphaeria arxii CBS 175.79]
MPKSNPMTGDDASRIQSQQAKSGGDMSSGGFSARAQSAAARNDNANAVSGSSGDFAGRAQNLAADNGNANSGTGQK